MPQRPCVAHKASPCFMCSVLHHRFGGLSSEITALFPNRFWQNSVLTLLLLLLVLEKIANSTWVLRDGIIVYTT